MCDTLTAEFRHQATPVTANWTGSPNPSVVDTPLFRQCVTPVSGESARACSYDAGTRYRSFTS